MKKFAVTYATVHGLLNNAEIRGISPSIKGAYDSANADTAEASCSACAKRKRFSDATSQLVTKLQGVSDLELDRIKKVLGVDKLVFPNGLSFTER